MPNRLPEEIYNPSAAGKAFGDTFLQAFQIAQERVRQKKAKKTALGEQIKMMIMQNMLQTGQTAGLPGMAEGMVDLPPIPQQGVPPGMIPTGGTVSGRGVSQTFSSPEIFALQQTKAQPKVTGTGKVRTFTDIRKRAEDQASKLATKIFNIGSLSKMLAKPEEVSEYIRTKEKELIKQYSREEGISLPYNWEKNLPESSLYKRAEKERVIADIKSKYESGRIKENKLEKILQRQGVTSTKEIIEQITGKKGQEDPLKLFD